MEKEKYETQKDLFYILENWVNGDYQANYLRTINRENKKYLISDCQRYVKSWDVPGQDYKYTFIYKWARKYFKDDSELGFRRSIDRNSNTDGVMNYSLVQPYEVQCNEDFKKLFEGKHLSLYDFNIPTNHPFSGWDLKTVSYLKSLFKTNEVYVFFDDGIERKPQSDLHKTGTLFHMNHFGIDKKFIKNDLQYYNRTIIFWLFENRLVFKYESGKDTW
jgi:hypothetical protein